MSERERMKQSRHTKIKPSHSCLLLHLISLIILETLSYLAELGAIFSSAKCPDSLILKAHNFAKEIRDGEMGVISGFHSPAEREVLEVLLKGKSACTGGIGRQGY